MSNGERGEGGSKDIKFEADKETEPTPQELATSFLRQRLLGIQRDIDSTRRSIKFDETYKPESPSAEMRGEPGSTEYTDYKVAALEAAQWPQEREAAIEDGSMRLRELERSMEEVRRLTEGVKGGDDSLISQFSVQEKDRRSKISERERIKKEQSGMEFEGAKETFEQMNELLGLVKTGNITTKMEGPGEWKLARDLGDQQQFYLKDGNGPMDGYATFISLREKEDGGFHIWFEDIEGVKTDPEKKGKFDEAVNKGVGLSFDLKDNIVSNQSVTETHPSRQWGYFEVQNDVSGERFDQNHFDEFKKRFDALVADMKELSKSRE